MLREEQRERASRITHYASRVPGFTLIELMIVIAIMGIVMTMSAPAIYHIWHKESLRKSVLDVMEACSRARALAIMRGTETALVFHAQDGTFEVQGGAAARPGGDSALPVELSMGGPNAGMSGKFPESVGIMVLKVNGVNCMDADQARVRFYPNGTCDELRLILLQPADGDMRGVYLEITTSLASVETDRYKLQSELK